MLTQQRRDEDTEITLAKPIEEIVKLLPIVFDPNQHLLDNLQEWKENYKKERKNKNNNTTKGDSLTHIYSKIYK